MLVRSILIGSTLGVSSFFCGEALPCADGLTCAEALACGDALLCGEPLGCGEALLCGEGLPCSFASFDLSPSFFFFSSSSCAFTTSYSAGERLNRSNACCVKNISKTSSCPPPQL